MRPRGQHIVVVAAPGHGAALDRPAMFLVCHQIGHHLAGMGAPRQAVDDGHGRVRGEFQKSVMVENADHDGVDITRQHARGVGDGLAAAELAHADIERHPRPGRGFFEDHRQRLALKRLLRLLALLLRGLQRGLHGHARREHVAKLLGRDLVEVEKMTQCLAHCVAACFDLSPESAVQARSSRCTPSSISASVTISGGSSRTTFSPAPTASKFCSRSAVTRSADGTTAFTPINKPSPRTSASTAGWRSTTKASFCLSSSDIFCTCSKKPGLSITSSTALAAATASGLPPNVEPCVPGVMPVAASAVARHAPIGKPPPSALASDITSGATPSRL